MFLLILLINTSIYFLFYHLSAGSELDQLEVQTTDIVEALISYPDVAQGELLKAFVPADGMIRVIQKNGQPLVTFTKESEYTSLPKEYMTAESHEVIKRQDGTNVAVITKPIIWDDGEVFTLQVSKHLLALQTTMRTLFYVLLIASVMMLIPTVIAGNVLGRFLLKPIQMLTRTMKANTKEANWKKIDRMSRPGDELYQMEKTFNEMIEHLKGNFQKQEQFVSDASHELKTPISIMKSYAQLLKRRGKERPEIFEEAVNTLDSEADHMQLVVEQMLTLAKHQNREESSWDNFDIITLCETAISTFHGAYTRDITLRTGSRELIMQGNEDQIKQVIYILIDNALKYSDKQVIVDVTLQNGKIIMKVTDFGNGISTEEQERIFDRFYRIDKARSRETGGTGLGLPIARSIVMMHHGTISVMSGQGEGSTFLVTLPLPNEESLSEF
jgi:signal transduction histidine kinase